MISTKDIAWLAGLLEGEGCFLFTRSPVVQLNMTDRDVVARAGQLLGAKSIGLAPQKNPRHKMQYRFKVGGRRAASWMMTIYPLMGERRQAKIREVLDQWKSAGSPEKKAERSRRLSEARRTHWASLTPEQKAAASRRMHEGKRRKDAALTQEQRSAIYGSGWNKRRARRDDQSLAPPQAA